MRTGQYEEVNHAVGLRRKKTLNAAHKDAQGQNGPNRCNRMTGMRPSSSTLIAHRTGKVDQVFDTAQHGPSSLAASCGIHCGPSPCALRPYDGAGSESGVKVQPHPAGQHVADKQAVRRHPDGTAL